MIRQHANWSDLAMFQEHVTNFYISSRRSALFRMSLPDTVLTHLITAMAVTVVTNSRRSAGFHKRCILDPLLHLWGDSDHRQHNEWAEPRPITGIAADANS